MPGSDTVMKALRFHRHGEPLDVLRVDEIAVPTPAADHIRVQVTACGLTPADSALCRGLFGSDLPLGIGLEVSGVVDAVGGNVSDVSVGDRVFGVPTSPLIPAPGWRTMRCWRVGPRFPTASTP